MKDERNFRAQSIQRVILYVYTVEKDFSLRRIVETRNQADKRRLAGACRAENGEIFSGFYIEIDVMEHRLAGRIGIAEGYAAEYEMTGLFLLAGSLIGAVRDRGNAVEHLVDTLCRGLCS